MTESRLASERRNHEVVEIGGFPFYGPGTEVTHALGMKLRELASDHNLSRRTAKYCHFHPDYAVRWTLAGRRHHALLCFGCGEIRFGTAHERYTYDCDHLKPFETLLTPLAKNRPSH